MQWDDGRLQSLTYYTKTMMIGRIIVGLRLPYLQHFIFLGGCGSIV